MLRISRRIIGVMRLYTSGKNSKGCDGNSMKDPCQTECVPEPCPPEEPDCPRPPTPSPICPTTEEILAKARLWRNLSLATIPGLLIMLVITMINLEKEKDKPRPPYKPMPHMYIRAKPFPWGDGNHGFFHNPERNAVPPDGYEVPDPYEKRNKHGQVD